MQECALWDCTRDWPTLMVVESLPCTMNEPPPQEKVLVIVSLSVGMLSLALPIYYRFTITGIMAEL